jgi:hypothetical protein
VPGSQLPMENLRLLVVGISVQAFSLSALEALSWLIVILAGMNLRLSVNLLLWLQPRICQQIVKFMSFYIPKYVINLISGYSLGV